MGLNATGKFISGGYVKLNNELIGMCNLKHGDHLMMKITQIIKKKDVIETEDEELWNGSNSSSLVE